MSRKPDPEIQRLMCALTDANERVGTQTSRVFRAVNALRKLRIKALRIARRIGKRQEELAAPKTDPGANGKDGAQ